MLYIVATPIGDKDDITIRALKILKDADIIVGEDYRYTDKLLKNYGINGKTIEILNEHNDEEKSRDLLDKLKTGLSVALTTDHGTPLIADPGWQLVDMCYKNNIKVVAIPGVSSIIAALSVAGIKVDAFEFYSRIPRNSEERKQFFIGLRKHKNLKVFIDAPYRLVNLLENIYYHLSNNINVIVCLNLTCTDEQIYRGNIKDILPIIKTLQKKSEFILITC